MPTVKQLPISSLHLDLDNYRTVHQKNEINSITAIISIKPDKFWALTESLLDDGYIAAENIILLVIDKKNVVKEGNRRIAALKIILGLVKGIDVPIKIRDRIGKITKAWKNENSRIPCTIYKFSEKDIVTKIVSQIHAKGEKAGRDQWTAVAKARYDRNQKGKIEIGLDLLEKYLKSGSNISITESERWSGDYPLSVLDEAIRKLFIHLEFATAIDLVRKYPLKNKTILENILHDIGDGTLGFNAIRDKINFFGNKYGMNIPNQTPNLGIQAPPTPIAQQITSGTPTVIPIPSKPIAFASTDPKSVYSKLKLFKPKGNGREKLVTLLNEIRRLKIDKHPHSFCFLLRSMFEISAKVYCTDHQATGGPSYAKSDGNDKNLADLLREITNHLTNNSTDKQKIKFLHGAITEIAKKDGLLSVTSMNQLVHNQSFSILSNDISVLFGNIFPLLEEMNK